MGSYRYNKIQNEIKSEVVTEYCIEAYEKSVEHSIRHLGLHSRVFCVCALLSVIMWDTNWFSEHQRTLWIPFFLTRHKNILFLNNGWLHTETGVWEGQKTFCSALLVRHHLSLSGLFLFFSSVSKKLELWKMRPLLPHFKTDAAGWLAISERDSISHLGRSAEEHSWKIRPLKRARQQAAQGSIRLYKNRWDAHLSKLGCTKETYWERRRRGTIW